MEAASNEEIIDCLMMFANELKCEKYKNTAKHSTEQDHIFEETSFVSHYDNTDCNGEYDSTSADKLIEGEWENEDEPVTQSHADTENQPELRNPSTKIDDFQTVFMKLAKAKYPHLSECFRYHDKKEKFQKHKNQNALEASSKLSSKLNLNTKVDGKKNLHLINSDKAVSVFFNYSQCLLKIAEAINPDLFKLLNDRLGCNLQEASDIAFRKSIPHGLKPPNLPTKIPRPPRKPLLLLPRNRNYFLFNSPSHMTKQTPHSLLLKNNKESTENVRGVDQEYYFSHNSTEYFNELKEPIQPKSKVEEEKTERGNTDSRCQTSIRETNSVTNLASRMNRIISRDMSSKRKNGDLERKIVYCRSTVPTGKSTMISGSAVSPTKVKDSKHKSPTSNCHITVNKPTISINLKSKIPIKSIYQNSETSSTRSDCEQSVSSAWKPRPPRHTKVGMNSISLHPELSDQQVTESTDQHSQKWQILANSNSSTNIRMSKTPSHHPETTKRRDTRCRACLFKLAHKFDPDLYNYLHACSKKN